MTSIVKGFQNCFLLAVFAALIGCSTAPKLNDEDPFPLPTSGSYDFPFDNPFLATVLGTPEGYRAELPERIPLKKREIEIFDRDVPDPLWFDNELRYS
ncbi:MAG: hypothetical protein ACR2O5_00590, partial [Thiogranum sp.]